MKIRNLLVGVCCLCTLNSFGQTMEWYSLWGSSSDGSHIRATSMVVDNEENIYVAADFCGDAVTVGNKTLISNQTDDLGDAVLVKMKSDKTIEWTLTFSQSNTATITDIILDSRDNIIVAGTFTGILNPGGQGQLALNPGIPENCTINGFITRINKEGQLLNQWEIPASKIYQLRVSLDDDDNIYLAGTYGNYIQFGTEGKGETSTDKQLYLAKYTPEGTAVWNKVIADKNVSMDNAVVKVDENGEIYLAGTFTGTYTFAGTQLTPTKAGVKDMFLVKYDASGNESWAKRMGGDSNEAVVDLALSPLGDVAVGGTFTSGSMTISNVDTPFTYTYRGNSSSLPHLAVTTFTKDGDFRWQYWYGYSSSAEAVVESLRCTDEGIYYVAGYASSRAADISTGTVISGVNSGLQLADGQHISHNTNGGADAIYLVLSPEGELCNYARPGGQQTEKIKDIALSPDKSNVYFLFDLCVRNAIADIPVDNLFVSFTDINNNKKTSDFTMITVPCPDAPVNGSYSGSSYAGKFYSLCVTRNNFPEVTPVELSDYTDGIAYSQQLSMISTQGDAVFSPLNLPETFSLENGLLTGTPTGRNNYSATVIASDKTTRYSYFAAYAGDNTWDNTYGGQTTRGNSRNVRNFILKPALSKSGTSTDLVFTGNWNAETFQAYGLQYNKITTLDFSETTGLTALPVMNELNPNCLIYVNKKHKINGTNIVSFTNGIETGIAESIILTENNDFNNEREFTAGSANYIRDFNGMNGWASICLPFMIDIAGMDIKEFSSAEQTERSGEESMTTVKFSSIESFTENTPYIIKVNAGTGEKTFEAIASDGKVIVPVTTLTPVDHNGITFNANLRKIEEGDATGLFLLNTDGSGFGQGSAESYVPSFRGYISASSQKAKTMILDLGDGEATKMEYLNRGETFYCYSSNGTLTIYTEEGCRAVISTIDGRVVKDMLLNAGTNVVSDLGKGIYLINNRKVVLN